MPTVPDYIYQPSYGVEPYNPQGVAESAQVGGGADETNDNLLVTLYGTADVPNLGGEPVYTLVGDLAKPVTAFGDFSSLSGVSSIDGLATIGSAQEFSSRNSCRFLMNPQAKQSLSGPFFAVLNPPQGIKQRLAGALSVEAVDVSAANPWGWRVTVHKSINDIYLPLARAVVGDEIGNIGEIIDIGGFNGGVFSILGLLATSGADGSLPTFLPNLPTSIALGATLSQVQTLIRALDTGNWYFPFFMALSPGDESAVITIEWPHSAGRN